MTVPPLQPIDLDFNSPVSMYLKKVTAVCPFIEPAARAGCLYGCVVTPDCQTAQDIHPRLFEQLVPQIERFRDARRALPEKQDRLLICHTVVIHLPPHLDAETARLLTWPNWLGWALKQLYTPKELVFGFVRKNVAERSSFGSPVPASPFHAVVIRSRVVNSDHRFFPNNQALLQAMMEADDDGLDVHAPALGQVPDIRDPQAMRDANYFQRVQQWGQKIVTESNTTLHRHGDGLTPADT
jgi:hypothetical protein